MFFRRRRYCGLWKLLLVIFGLKVVTRSRLTDEERRAYRDKARKFRSKLKEAYAVWDDPADAESAADDADSPQAPQAEK